MSSEITPLKPVPLYAAILLSVGGGYGLSLSFPRPGWWWLAPFSLAMLLFPLWGRNLKTTLLLGFVSGQTFYLALLSWSSLFLGPLPWIALATVETLFWVGGIVLLHLADRWWPPPWTNARVFVFPVLAASLWLLREINSNSWPYGGFAWGRVGQSQSEGFLAELASWIGVNGLSLVLVWFASGMVEVLRLWLSRGSCRMAWFATTVLIVDIVLASCLPGFQLPIVGKTVVAGAQGGSEKAGFFRSSTAGEVTDLHVAASKKLYNQQPQPSLLVWPEGGADYDPAFDAQTATTIDQLSQQLQAPILVGTIHDTNVGKKTTNGPIYNQVQLWEHGKISQTYDKRNPVPFGEYVPDRKIWSRFAPKEIALISREFKPGQTDPIITAGAVRYGVGICFDIIDDELMRESLTQGAQAFLYPTNNADFGTTHELDQQLAIARLRALESGRSVVQVSTVGRTVAINPQGHTIAALPSYTNAALLAEIPLTAGRTPAVLLGPWLSIGLSSVAGLCLMGLGMHQLALRRKRAEPAQNLNLA